MYVLTFNYTANSFSHSLLIITCMLMIHSCSYLSALPLSRKISLNNPEILPMQSSTPKHHHLIPVIFVGKFLNISSTNSNLHTVPFKPFNPFAFTSCVLSNCPLYTYSPSYFLSWPPVSLIFCNRSLTPTLHQIFWKKSWISLPFCSSPSLAFHSVHSSACPRSCSINSKLGKMEFSSYPILVLVLHHLMMAFTSDIHCFYTASLSGFWPGTELTQQPGSCWLDLT